MSSAVLSPAELAALEAQARVADCIKQGRNFRLEAGAGAGKTYSLVEALRQLVAERGRELVRSGRQVACITFTEVAKDEIRRKVEEHPAVLVETIHSFSWSLMSQFQRDLRLLVSQEAVARPALVESVGVNSQTVEYSHGFFGVDEAAINLSHDDVPGFAAALMRNRKFRSFLCAKFPVLFIDEYQDTDARFMAALADHFFESPGGPLIGLFGDHWQTIYRSDYALPEFSVEGIDKRSNFRSAPAIVNVLNRLRPELTQEVGDPVGEGEAVFFHANGVSCERTSSPHSKGDLPSELAKAAANSLLAELEVRGWDVSPAATKVLMLTHNALAAEQGYPHIAKLFKRSEAYAKKEDSAIEFFADVVEPVVRAFNDRRFGDMFRALGAAPAVRRHADKLTCPRRAVPVEAR